MPTSGLLTQKPDSPAPEVGAVKNFSTEQREKKDKPGEFWTKVKNEGEGFGSPYTILKAEKTDFVDTHGNVSYSVLIEGAGNEPNRPAQNTPTPTPNNKDEEIARAVAFKGAVELVAKQVTGDDSYIDIRANVADLTNQLLPIVKGQTSPPTEPAQEPDKDSIPF